MNPIYNAIRTICTLEELAMQDGWLNRCHPLIKIIITFGYILTVTSIHKYALLPLLVLAIYPIALFALGGLNIYQGFYRLKVILVLALFVGIANPILDTKPFAVLCSITITGGMVSLITFALKGVLTIAASYLLMVSTTVKDICIALKILRVPAFFLTQILLMYRYVIVILHTLADMQISYQLRSKLRYGIAPRDWGTFAGQLLLHSFNRAEQLYQSMLLRNYTPEKFCLVSHKIALKDVFYLFFWFSFFLLVKLLEAI